MIKFLQNIGEFFSSNYFDEDFAKKVLDKSGYAAEDLKKFNKQVSALKDKYYRFKLGFLEGKLRTKDKVTETHRFHSEVLNALGYLGNKPEYEELLHIDETTVLPVRHVLYRGNQPHLMIMEMQALLKEGDAEPDGLFEQRYSTDDEETQTPPQKYHRSQWREVFKVPEGLKISPMVINKAVSELFLTPLHRRPKYILLCAGNQYFLLEQEKWFRGSYLQISLEDLFDEASIKRDYYSLFYFLLAKEALAPQSDIVLMDQLDEDSHKSAYEVTKDLKEGVIHAVESIANEAVYFLTSQGIELGDINASALKDDCLTMVYRLLFLFYAESREDLDILPSNDEVYEQGYSLEMLRDLEQVPLNTASSQNGYFFHESLYRLFNLLNNGFRENQAETKSFKIRHLDSPLFDDSNLTYLPKVKLRNSIWQDVICQLSLSRKQKGKARGRISYANLGINQLGSVYESLLAFRGFLADTDYIEVHRKRKANESSQKVVNSDGSYLVPRHRLDDFDTKEVYREGNDDLRIIKKGMFIYRLSGRDRQNSASYYTPEVLTQCTVKYTLKPILERIENGEMKALDLLSLKILEPAMGAAAFHNEVINQLAETYLVYRQQETGKKVSPDKYREETQKVKAFIALNNVYGVDLNPTAVELGKLSLWLNVIHKDMQTPFFGYRLGVGNAVVGAWLKVYKHRDFSFEPIKAQSERGVKKEWWEKAPRHLKFNNSKIQRAKDEIYHFLLPDKNMLASAGVKLLKQEFPEQAAHITAWRKEFCLPLKGDEYRVLLKIASAIDELLELHYQFQSSVNIETQIKGDFFEAYDNAEQIKLEAKSYQEKAKIAAERTKTNAPYYKLKLIMDYWCSLWFWDMRDAKDLPARQEWYDDLVKILNIDLEATEIFESNTSDDGEQFGVEPSVQGNLFGGAQQLTFKSYKKEKTAAQAIINKALTNQPSSLFANRRSELVMELANRYHFFNYQLEFIEVFRERNGFDIVVGNPPWVNIEVDLTGLLSEKNPEIKIREMGAAEVNILADRVFALDENLYDNFTKECTSVVSLQAFLGSSQNYSLLSGQKNNLYRALIALIFNILSREGYSGIVHPETIYEDPKAFLLRKTLYKHLKYHFHFRNGLNLFAEIGHKKSYGINIMSGTATSPAFYSIVNLYHPKTIDGCFIHDGFGSAGGITKIVEGKSTWNLQPHKNRLIYVTSTNLKTFATSFENDESLWEGVKLPSIHSSEILNVVSSFSKLRLKLEECKMKIVIGLDEAQAVKNKLLIERPGLANYDKWDIVLGGPNFFVSNAINKSATKKGGYEVIDLTSAGEDFLPHCIFHYSDDFDINKNINLRDVPSLQNFRIIISRMLDSKTERTLQASIIPPRYTHLNSSNSIYFDNPDYLIEATGLFSSVVFDFYIRATGATNVTESIMKNMRIGLEKRLKPYLFARTLLLNCLNKHYRSLWECHWDEAYKADNWSKLDNRLSNFNSLSPNWEWSSPLRNWFERRQALVEIDVITAIGLKLKLEDLILIYNVQFPVLQLNEDDTWYDANGNIVFTCSKGLTGVGLDRPVWETIKDLKEGQTYEHTIEKSELYYGQKVTYYAPFDKCDRVEDYKQAWQHFEKVFI